MTNQQDHHREYQQNRRQMTTLQKLKSICIFLTVFILVLSNLFNYFVSYKLLNDINLQWSIAMYAIAIELFLFSVYVWLCEVKKSRNQFKIIISGWMVIYLLINLIGVCLGNTLHTKGFMLLLFVTMFGGLMHIIFKLWQKYY